MSVYGNLQMIRTSPEQFRSAFAEAVEDAARRGDTVFAGAYKESTKAIRERLFPAIATRLGLNCYSKDLYTLDSVFYGQLDKTNFPKGNYPKYIAVALEHENNSKASHEEIWKLQLFNAPLKVLIVYHPETSTEELLSKYTSIIRDADIFGDIPTLRRQLVIIGTPVTAENWRYYAYETGGFRQI